MINVGDFVTHIGFPPAEGIVVLINKPKTSTVGYSVGVRLDDGRIVWGEAKEWEKSSNGEDIDMVIDVDSVEVL